jgi:AcrR family transcriptional regulator
MERPGGAYHHKDLRRALVETSLTLVRDQGVDGFSLRAAARSAGVDPAAVYRHFADRSALLGAVASVGFRQLADEIASGMAAAGGPAGARFAAAGRSYVSFARANPEYLRVMFGPYGSGPLRAAADAGDPSAYGLLVGVLRDLLDEGVIVGPVDRAAVTAWAAIHGMSTLLVDRAIAMTEQEIDDAVDHLVRSVLHGLGMSTPLT